MNRILKLNGSRNVRELGGYKTKDGFMIKWNKLVRSAELSNLDKNDQNFLTDYGIKTIIDFRSEDEIEQAPDVDLKNVIKIINPILHRDETENSKSPEDLKNEMISNPAAGPERMKNVYYKMVTSTESKLAYYRFFETLLAKGNNGIIFHCTSGKDRTGLGSIYLLTALGVPEETIKRDYLLTNEVITSYINEIIEKMQKEHQPSILINNIKALYTVNISYYLEAKKWITKLSGSTENYLMTELKLSSGDLKDLKKMFLNC